MRWILVALGSAAGGVARYWLAQRLAAVSAAYPVGTFVVNLSGCALIGFLAAWRPAGALGSPEARLLLATGFCGGFTTFSAFAGEMSLLSEGGARGLAAAYAVSSVALGFVLFRAGLWLGRLAGG
jgi:fluoride exporter